MILKLVDMMGEIVIMREDLCLQRCMSLYLFRLLHTTDQCSGMAPR